MQDPVLVLSVFGDEISADLREQLETLRGLGVGWFDLRSAWGKNVVDFTESEVAESRRLLAKYEIGVACIGSPIGKSPIAAPPDFELGRLRWVLDVAAALDTRLIRIFSFFPPEGAQPPDFDASLPESARRLSAMASLAEARGVCLVMENEAPLVGNTPERCRALLQAVDSPALRLAWDPANFYQTGIARPAENAWPVAGRYTGHVHIKDVRPEAGGPPGGGDKGENPMCPPGEGAGQIPELLEILWRGGYRGYLALEPHLKFAGSFGGFSGPDGVAVAVAALRRLMAAGGYAESERLS